MWALSCTIKKGGKKIKQHFIWTLQGTPPISVSIFNDKSSTANLNLLNEPKKPEKQLKGHATYQQVSDAEQLSCSEKVLLQSLHMAYGPERS
jgi:hypothetical protein